MVKSQDYDYLFKVLMIGDSGVGKSSILNRYCGDGWNSGVVCTIGVDFKIKIVNVAGKKVKLQLWDTAGQERFRNITAAYYRGASGVIIVYDVTNRDSLQNVQKWAEQVDSQASTDVKKIVVGNKADTETMNRVGYDEARAMTGELGLDLMEVSAKTMNNIAEIFELLAMELVAKAEKEALQRLQNPNREEGNKERLGDSEKKDSSGSCC